MSSSLYERLDVDSYEIRLLHLGHASDGPTLKCSLTRHSLLNPLPYAALSYCWGIEGNIVDIIVNDKRQPVSANLAAALQRLRQIGVGLVWADQICVNQSDNHEKSLQVRHMTQVYSRAELTYAWLGVAENDRTVAAIEFLGELRTTEAGLPDAVHDHASESSVEPVAFLNNCRRCSLESSFRDLQDLLNRDYWRRRWIIQEIAVSSQVRVLCGDHDGIDLQEMEAALDACTKSSYWLASMNGSYHFIERTLGFRQRYRLTDTLPLCEVMYETRDFLSRDRRDRIYALVGVCSDGPILISTPNYYQATAEITTDLSRSLIRHRLCYDTIAIEMERQSRAPGLPTWVVDWLSHNVPKEAHELANEMPRLTGEWGIRSLRGAPNTLIVEGVILGVVVNMSSILGSSTRADNEVLAEVANTAENARSDNHYTHPFHKYGSKSRTQEAFLRCLIAPPSCKPSGVNGAKLRKVILKLSSIIGDGQEDNERDDLSQEECEVTTHFERELDNISRDLYRAGKQRRRLVICDTGLMGMSCPDIVSGAIICFLAGCSSAIALRETTAAGTTTGDHC
ncbi:heterokaryon incompatibility protein-domain-containing protein [Xylariaceae sp. FL0255]|nr:heterokaryon incompatibility protein-domain-containing protein [Xylariaceae sp. FL0255]